VLYAKRGHRPRGVLTRGASNLTTGREHGHLHTACRCSWPRRGGITVSDRVAFFDKMWQIILSSRTDADRAGASAGSELQRAPPIEVISWECQRSRGCAFSQSSCSERITHSPKSSRSQLSRIAHSRLADLLSRRLGQIDEGRCMFRG
jgi:hypothetical protein